MLTFSYVVVLSYLVPIVAAWRYQVVSLPLRLVAVYCGLALGQSLYMVYLASSDVRNLWLIHAFVPVQATLLLSALALWQVRELARTTVFVSIPMFLMAWLMLTLTVESLESFPRYVKTIEGLLIVAVAAYTLLTRSQFIAAPVTAFSWFWVSAALLTYFAFVSIVNPASSYLLSSSPGRLRLMSLINFSLVLVCNLGFARAMVVPGRGEAAVNAPAAAR
ncbi:MAG TPA: hypothetical protein VK012_07300 [Gemmatimonadales bacterium]|nr:hypothetical protein [Gemmatimonadales bacterium]